MEPKLIAAADLFAERGLDASKMEDVAAVTGIPKATLYYYFTGKEEILAFLFHTVLRKVREAIEAAAFGSGTAAERLERIISAHLQVFADYPAASRTLQFDLGRAARLPDIASSVEASFVGPVMQLLEEGANDRSLRRVPHPRMAAVALLGAVTTVGMNGLAPEHPMPVASLAKDLCDLVLTGLREKGKP
ncbi:MAG TPA: TetR/AcrR family transcriptional regulator [Acidimicrobiales bacterium]